MQARLESQLSDLHHKLEQLQPNLCSLGLASSRVAVQEEGALRAPLTWAEQLHLVTHLRASTVLRQQPLLPPPSTVTHC